MAAIPPPSWLVTYIPIMTFMVAMAVMKIVACITLVRAVGCIVAMLNASRKSNKKRKCSISAHRRAFAMNAEIAPAAKNNAIANPFVLLGQNLVGNRMHREASEASSITRCESYIPASGRGGEIIRK